MRAITVIDAPTSAGAYAPGQERGCRAHLTSRLRDAGHDVVDGGGCAPFRWRPDPDRPRAANADAVVERAAQVAELVAGAGEERFALVLGGDCTAGAQRLAQAPRDAAREALAAVAGDGPLGVQLDCDVVDFLDAPLAENTDRGPAPSLAATGAAFAELLADGRVVALTVTEFNPDHGAPDGSDTRRLVDVLVEALAA